MRRFTVLQSWCAMALRHRVRSSSKSLRASLRGSKPRSVAQSASPSRQKSAPRFPGLGLPRSSCLPFNSASRSTGCSDEGVVDAIVASTASVCRIPTVGLEVRGQEHDVGVVHLQRRVGSTPTRPMERVVRALEVVEGALGVTDPSAEGVRGHGAMLRERWASRPLEGLRAVGAAASGLGRPRGWPRARHPRGCRGRAAQPLPLLSSRYIKRSSACIPSPPSWLAAATAAPTSGSAPGAHA